MLGMGTRIALGVDSRFLFWLLSWFVVFCDDIVRFSPKLSCISIKLKSARYRCRVFECMFLFIVMGFVGISR